MADVSHELRTPLTVLKGQLRAALDRVYAFDEVDIANLYEQTDHLIRLVNDLHELAQAEANQLPLSKAPTDVSHLLHEVIQTFQPLADEKQITLQSDIVEPLPVMVIDAARIRQVLHNLLGNALQFTSCDGKVMVNALEFNHELRITVRDNGIGIPPQHIAHVFDRFFRVDASRSRDTGGSGLGLAVARAIIEAHGGTLTAQSPGTNQGTAFTITLPTP
jgi:signal transduction histidine kinase